MKVIFAVDDSKYGMYALETVGSRPWPNGTEFRLLSVLELGRDESQEVQVPVINAIKESLANKAAALNTLHPGSRVDTKIVQGNPKEAILQEAEEWGASHIIVGSHGRKGIQRFLLGSVAEAILAQAPCTVEVVRIKGDKRD